MADNKIKGFILSFFCVLAVVSGLVYNYQTKEVAYKSGGLQIGSTEGLDINKPTGGSGVASHDFGVLETVGLVVTIDNDNGYGPRGTNAEYEAVDFYRDWIPSIGTTENAFFVLPTMTRPGKTVDSHVESRSQLRYTWYDEASRDIRIPLASDSIHNAVIGFGLAPTNVTGGIFKPQLAEAFKNGGMDALKAKWKTFDNSYIAKSQSLWRHFAGDGINGGVEVRINDYMALGKLDLNNIAGWTTAEKENAFLSYLDLLLTCRYAVGDSNAVQGKWDTILDGYLNEGPGVEYSNYNLVITPGTILIQDMSNPSSRRVLCTSIMDNINYGYTMQRVNNISRKEGSKILPQYALNTGGSGIYAQLHSVIQTNVNSLNVPITNYPVNKPFPNLLVYQSIGRLYDFNTKEFTKAKGTMNLLESMYTQDRSGAKYFGKMLILGVPLSESPVSSKSLTSDFKVYWADNGGKYFETPNSNVADTASLIISLNCTEADLPAWNRICDTYDKFQLSFNIKSTKESGRFTETTKDKDGVVSTLDNPSYTVDGAPYTVGNKLDVDREVLRKLLNGKMEYTRLYDKSTNSQVIAMGELQHFGYNLDVTIHYQDKNGKGGSYTTPMTGWEYDTSSKDKEKHCISVFREEENAQKITWYSDPEAFSELKEGTVDYGSTASRENYEAMAGVPSTEMLYFSSGGSEFIVELELEYVEGEEGYRKYQTTFFGTECEFKHTDALWEMAPKEGTEKYKEVYRDTNTQTQSVKSPNATLQTGEHVIQKKLVADKFGNDSDMNYDSKQDVQWYKWAVAGTGTGTNSTTANVAQNEVISGHTNTIDKTDPEGDKKQNSSTVYATWTGIIYNHRGTSTEKADSSSNMSNYVEGDPAPSCAGGKDGYAGDFAEKDTKWDVTGYHSAIDQAIEWAEAYQKTNEEYTVKMLADSDGYARVWRIGNAKIEIDFSNGVSNQNSGSRPSGVYTSKNAATAKKEGNLATWGNNFSFAFGSNGVSGTHGDTPGSEGPPAVASIPHGEDAEGKKTIPSTVTGVGNINYTIKVTFDNGTLDAHELCGTCCSHDLPRVQDAWYQKSKYDYARLNVCRVYKIYRSYVDGVEEITFADYNSTEDASKGNDKKLYSGPINNYTADTGLFTSEDRFNNLGVTDSKRARQVISASEQAKKHNGTDTIVAAINQGDPNIFYNIAMMSNIDDNTYLSYANEIENKQPSAMNTIARRVMNSYHNNLMMNCYFEEFTQRGDYTASYGGKTSIPSYYMYSGSRSNKCDGIISTVGGSNQIKVDANGHDKPTVSKGAESGKWFSEFNTGDNAGTSIPNFSVGILYTRLPVSATGLDPSQMNEATLVEHKDYYDVNKSPFYGTSDEYWMGTTTTSNDYSCKTLVAPGKVEEAGGGAYNNSGYTYAGFNPTGDNATAKTKYNATTIDAIDYLSEEYHRFRFRRNVRNTLYVVSDMLMLQTSTGDQSVMSHWKSQTKRLQQNYDYTISDVDQNMVKFDSAITGNNITLKESFADMWYNQKSGYQYNTHDVHTQTAKGWGINNVGTDGGINVGGYLGLYNQPDRKYSSGVANNMIGSLFDTPLDGQNVNNGTGGQGSEEDNIAKTPILFNTLAVNAPVTDDFMFEKSVYNTGAVSFGGNKANTANEADTREKRGWSYTGRGQYGDTKYNGFSSITAGPQNLWRYLTTNDNPNPDMYKSNASGHATNWGEQAVNMWRSAGMRMTRPAGALRAVTDKIEQDPTNPNKLYETGTATQTYMKILDWPTVDVGDMRYIDIAGGGGGNAHRYNFTKKNKTFKSKFLDEVINVTDEDRVNREGAKKYTVGMKPMVETVTDGYTLEATYSKIHDKINNIVVFNPISVKEAVIKHNETGEESKWYADTRTGKEDLTSTSLNDKLEKLQVCSGNPDTCEFKVLKCVYVEDKVRFSSDFDTDVSISGGKTVVTNLADKNQKYELPAGFNVVSSYQRPDSSGKLYDYVPFGNNQGKFLDCKGVRWSLPLNKLGITYRSYLQLKVDMDFYMDHTKTKGTMVVSFNNYDFYIPGGMYAAIPTWNTGNGWERKYDTVNMYDKELKVTLLFDFGDVAKSRLFINGNEITNVTIVNNSSTITSAMIGEYINIGSWIVDDVYPASFVIDNLTITELGETELGENRSHTDVCYQTVREHERAQQYTCGISQLFTYDALGGGTQTSGKPYVFVAPKSGVYRLEAWGASGGGATTTQGASSAGGLGGYTRGYVSLTEGEQIMVYPGGSGGNKATTTLGIEYFWTLHSGCGDYSEFVSNAQETKSGINYINSVNGKEELTNVSLAGVWSETLPSGYTCGNHSVSVAVDNATKQMVQRTKGGTTGGGTTGGGTTSGGTTGSDLIGMSGASAGTMAKATLGSGVSLANVGGESTLKFNIGSKQKVAQLINSDLNLTAGKTYTLSFKAKTTSDKDILHVDIMPDKLEEALLTLTNKYETYTWTFKPTETPDSFRIFSSIETFTGDVTVQDIHLYETSGTPGLVTKTFNNATYARVFYQSVTDKAGQITANTQGFFDASTMRNALDNLRFSDLGNLDSKYKYNGKFEFMLNYPDSGDTKYNHWTQTANPFDVKTNVGSIGKVNAPGYTPIHMDWISESYGSGLEYNGSSAILDGAVGEGYWWLAVGAFNNDVYPIPGPLGSVRDSVQQCELWARADINFIPNAPAESSKTDTFGGAGFNGGGSSGVGGYGGGGASDARRLSSGGKYVMTGSYDKTDKTEVQLANLGKDKMSDNGTLTYGPYEPATTGTYQVDIYGKGLSDCTFDVYDNAHGGIMLNHGDLSDLKISPTHVSFYFDLAKASNATSGTGLEVRTHHSKSPDYSFDSMFVSRLEDRIIVAGGGGGADNASGTGGGSDDGSGGFGGGLAGGNAKVDGRLTKSGIALADKLQSEVDKIKDAFGGWKAIGGIAMSGCGLGGTQESGYALGRGESVTYNTDTGGAGGGFYGGYVTNHGNGGAGGGSGYIDPGASDTYVVGNANNGNGKVRVGLVSHENKEGLSQSFGFTGAVQEWTVPESGEYRLETWGAQGGDGRQVNTTTIFNNTGGSGGYTTSIYSLYAGQKLYFYVGGQGEANSATTHRSSGKGGWNGGGTGGTDNDGSSPESGAGGGGMTHISLANSDIVDSSKFDTSSVLLVAGGGGGSGSLSTAQSYSAYGGVGGGFEGKSRNAFSKPGTQKSGYLSGKGKDGLSDFNAVYSYGVGTGGNGGGYYGGYWTDGEHPNKYSLTDLVGGAGGSGYIDTERTRYGNLRSGDEVQPSSKNLTDTQVGNRGNGAARITKLNRSHDSTCTFINTEYNYHEHKKECFYDGGTGELNPALKAALNAEYSGDGSQLRTLLGEEVYNALHSGEQVLFSASGFTQTDFKGIRVDAYGTDSGAHEGYGAKGKLFADKPTGDSSGQGNLIFAPTAVDSSVAMNTNIAAGSVSKITATVKFEGVTTDIAELFWKNANNGFSADKSVLARVDTANTGYQTLTWYLDGRGRYDASGKPLDPGFRDFKNYTNWKDIITGLRFDLIGNNTHEQNSRVVIKDIKVWCQNGKADTATMSDIKRIVDYDFKTATFGAQKGTGTTSVTKVADGVSVKGDFSSWDLRMDVEASANTVQFVDITFKVKSGVPTSLLQSLSCGVTTVDSSGNYIRPTGFSDNIANYAPWKPQNESQTITIYVGDLWRGKDIKRILFDIIPGSLSTPAEIIVESVNLYGYGSVTQKGSLVQNDYAYTGKVQEFIAPTDGNYTLSVWGARGGSYDASGKYAGLGGFSGGTKDLNKGDKLSIYVGGIGARDTATSLAEWYTPGHYTYTIPSSGYYTMQAWGAAGGGTTEQTVGSHAGYGGYSKGKKWFDKGQVLHVFIGGMGTYSSALGTGGGYNGGGQGGPGGYGGGGMTHISTAQNQATAGIITGSQQVPMTSGTKTYSVGEIGWTCTDGSIHAVVFDPSNTGTITLDATHNYTIGYHDFGCGYGGSSYVNNDWGHMRDDTTGTCLSCGHTCGFNSSYGQWTLNKFAPKINNANHVGLLTTAATYTSTGSWNPSGTIIVAGGGGGSDDSGSALGAGNDGSGGAGGGSTGSNPTIDGVAQGGYAGTQTSGYRQGLGESVTTATDTGGAGAGWYGGKVTNHFNGGAGGGSGYVGGLLNAESHNGWMAANGAVRITAESVGGVSGGFNGGGSGGTNAYGGGGATDIRNSYRVTTTNGMGAPNWAGSSVSGDTWTLPNTGKLHIHTNNGGMPISTNGTIWQVVYAGTNLSNLKLEMSQHNGTNWVSGGSDIIYSKATQGRAEFIIKATQNYPAIAFCLTNDGSTATITRADVSKLSDRFIVAGGGGGTADSVHGLDYYGNLGGSGGGATGTAGTAEAQGDANITPAQPGTQTTGGAGGINKLGNPNTGGSGAFGFGGNGITVRAVNDGNNIHSGGGGGAGYYGGGGASGWYQGGGAGGSGYIGGVTGGTMQTGVNNGYGRAAIYSNSPTILTKEAGQQIPTIKYASSFAGLDGSEAGMNSAVEAISQYTDSVTNNIGPTIPREVNGLVNPIYYCYAYGYNKHVHTEVCEKETKVLKCMEPHHDNMHYETTADALAAKLNKLQQSAVNSALVEANKSGRKFTESDYNKAMSEGQRAFDALDKSNIRGCYEACNKDANHKKANSTTTDKDGNKIGNIYINTDEYFDIYFPNTGDFCESDLHGIKTTVQTRGMGYEDNTDTGNHKYPHRAGDIVSWVRERYVKFDFDVLFYRAETGYWEQYLANTWIELPVEGANNDIGYAADSKHDNGHPVYHFYCTLNNNERAAATVTFESEGINCRDSYGKYNYHDNNGYTGTWVRDTLTGKSLYQKLSYKMDRAVENPASNHVNDNDNKSESTNRDRRVNLTSLHGATVTKFTDVVGRIGNMVMTSTSDIRFVNFFKKSNPNGAYLINGVVQEVFEDVQRDYLSWHWNTGALAYDVRHRNVSRGTHMYNTWGTSVWKGSSAQAAEVVAQGKDPSALPLASDRNNIEVYKNELLKPGYSVNYDITTTGNYDNRMQVKPYFYALALEDDDKAGIKAGTLIPVDVYMKTDEDYKGINFFGLADGLPLKWADGSVSNVTDDEIQEQINTYIISLDWKNEAKSRMYTDMEKELTEAIHDNFVESTFVDDNGQVVVDSSDTTKLPNTIPVRIPNGDFFKLGNLQSQIVTNQARTYLGSRYTMYENFRNGDSAFEHDTNLKGLVDDLYYTKQAQRWHLKLGLPSSAVFTLYQNGVHMKPLDEKIVDGEKIRAFEELNSGNYAIVMTANLKSMGDIWNLYYTQEANNGVFRVGGKTYSIETDFYEFTTNKKGDSQVVLAVYDNNTSSQVDIDVIGTH